MHAVNSSRTPLGQRPAQVLHAPHQFSAHSSSAGTCASAPRAASLMACGAAMAPRPTSPHARALLTCACEIRV